LTKVIARELLPKVGKLLEEQLGLYFSAERYTEMEKKVLEALRDFGYQDSEEGIKWLLSAKLNSKEIETLAKALAIGETYFFREKNTLKALEDHVLPELINQRRGKNQTLRIWSAGCSTGEEPYSLAILLKKLLGDIDNWNIKI